MEDDAEDDDVDAVPSSRRASRLSKDATTASKQPKDACGSTRKTNPNKSRVDKTNQNELTRAEDEEESDRANDESGGGGKNSGEKRFVLPKRSVHSSRVIKPNKRFMDEAQASTKKNGITSQKKSSKSETNESRPDSPVQPTLSSKSPAEAMDTDAKDGKRFEVGVPCEECK